jgi:signal transduction histidine kinase
MVLRNVVHNAVKAATPGGHVTVRGERRDGRAILDVRDDGVGFAPEEGERLFDKFYRIEREELGRMQGTGLGLFLVRRNVELDQGEVRASSEGPGKGAVFTIIWPALGEGKA